MTGPVTSDPLGEAVALRVEVDHVRAFTRALIEILADPAGWSSRAS